MQQGRLYSFTRGLILCYVMLTRSVGFKPIQTLLRVFESLTLLFSSTFSVVTFKPPQSEQKEHFSPFKRHSIPQQTRFLASSKKDSESSLAPDKTWPFACHAAFFSPSHRRLRLFGIPPKAQRFGRALDRAETWRVDGSLQFSTSDLQLTILSRSSSMADMSFPNCFKLSAITCSSSVCVEPMHSKLNSFRLFASVLWHRERSAKKRQRASIFTLDRACSDGTILSWSLC